MNIKPMSLCALVFASTICFSAPDPVNALPPKKQNKPPICSGSLDPFKNKEGHDYRSNRLAQRLQARKQIMQELKQFHDPKAAQEWLKQQAPLAPEDMQRIEDWWQQGLIFPGLSPCAEVDTSGWLGPDEINVPVVIVEFPENPYSYSTSDLEAELFGGATYTTIQDYYDEVSYHQMTITGDVYGVYTMTTSAASYPSTSAGTEQFVTNAIALIDSSIDFSQYDADGDNFVDALVLCARTFPSDPSIAGRARQGSVSDYLTDDGVYISEYTLQYQSDGVEVYIHELGHILGLPDQYAEGTRIGIGEWCTMSSGVYNNPPVHFCAWCKTYLGWVSPTLVSGFVDDQSIRNVENYADIFELLPGNIPYDEYFLVENRQQTGLDINLPGSGLLIWHVGSDGEPALLEEADGRDEVYNDINDGDTTDPYYDGNNTEFTSTTTPSSDYSDGTASDVEVTDISASGLTMTADLYNPELTSDWDLTIDGEDSAGRDIAVDNQGNTYITGSFTGTEDFDPLGSGYNMTSYGGQDGFVAKYDGDGLLVWAKHFGSTNDDDYGRSIAVDANGDIYLAGVFSDSSIFEWILWVPIGFTSNGDTDIFVAKLDSNGNYVWLRHIGGTGRDWAKGIAVDPLYNDATDPTMEDLVYVCGYFQNTVDFDPGTGTNNLTAVGNTDAYLLKLYGGNHFGANRIGGSGGDVAFGVVADDSYVYVCGYHQSPMCYVGSTTSGSSRVLMNYGDADAFVACYTKAPSYVQWAHVFGGPDEDKAFDMAIDNDSNIYLTGHFNDTATFSTRSVTAGGSASEAFACKLNSTGAVKWAKAARQYGSGSDANGISTGRGIAVEPNGCDLYVTGQYQGYVDFDPSSRTTDWMYGPVCSYCECDKVFLWNLETDGSYKSTEENGLDGENMGYAVTVDLLGDIYTTGYFSEDIDCPTYDDDYGKIFIWKK